MTSPQLSDYEQLNLLVEAGDTISVLEHITATNINATDYKSSLHFMHSPVYVAARWGHVDIMQALISVGFDYTTPEISTLEFENGVLIQPTVSPLQIASFYGHVDVVKILVEDYGVDVNYGEEHVPLWYAISGGHLDVVTYLIEHGTSVSIQASSYMSPLMCAIEFNRADICEYLISVCANASVEDDLKKPALFMAVQNGNIAISRALIDSGVDVNMKNKEGSTAFLIAAEQGNVDMLKFLYSRGADPYIMDKSSKTALHFAIESNNMEITHYLVVDINMIQRPYTDKEYFNLAVAERAYAIIVLLIKAGYAFTHRHYQMLEEAFDTTPTPDCLVVLTFVRQTVAVPRSLEELTCLKIRGMLGGNIKRVESLPLPGKLLDLIQLKHIEIER